MVHRNPVPPSELGCHRTGFKKKCGKLVMGGVCDRWRSHPVQDGDGKIFQGFDCLDNWHAQYQSDTVQQTAQLGAAQEATRNRLVDLITKLAVPLYKAAGMPLPNDLLAAPDLPPGRNLYEHEALRAQREAPAQINGATPIAIEGPEG